MGWTRDRLYALFLATDQDVLPENKLQEYKQKQTLNPLLLLARRSTNDTFIKAAGALAATHFLIPPPTMGPPVQDMSTTDRPHGQSKLTFHSCKQGWLANTHVKSALLHLSLWLL